MICLNCGCKVDLGSKFCAHCGTPTSISDGNNVGTITIIREKKTLGFAINFEVYIDDSKLGILKNNSSLTCPVSYGPHEIKLTSTEKDVIQNIEISEEKKNAEAHIIPKMGLIAAKPFIKEIKYN